MYFYNLKIFKRKIPMMIIATLLCMAAVICAVSGCSETIEKDDKLEIVATTTMLYDLSLQIGGDCVRAEALMGPGIDPHLYQASAGDVAKLQGADVVVYNGVHLEGKMGDVFSQLDRQEKNIICAGDALSDEKLLSSATNPDIHDPHIWFDVSNWKCVAQHMCDELIKVDPKNRAVYMNNLKNYEAELSKLDEYIKKRTSEVAVGQRVLITAHDAFRYFGKAYGFEVRGLQGTSTATEAGTADVSNLAKFIADRKIKAIFVESSIPPKNIEALQAAVKAKGFSVQIGGELYSDSLGDKNSGADTYILTFKKNIDTIIDALR